MDKRYEHISQIENYLSMLLTSGKVSSHIFVGELPAALDKDIDEMVLIDVYKSSDYDSHGDAYANIFVYARPTGSTLRKAVKQLNKMENALTAIVEDPTPNIHYIPQVIYRDSGYDSNRGFHYNIMNVRIIIK